MKQLEEIMMKKIYIILTCLHFFVGVGAIFGGIGVIIDSSGKGYGITTDILKYGPFNDFLIPGLILFIFLGIIGLITAVFSLKYYQYQAYLSGIMGVGLIVFITVQCMVLNGIHYLHVIFFVIGLLETILAITLAFKKKLNPFK